MNNTRAWMLVTAAGGWLLSAGAALAAQEVPGICCLEASDAPAVQRVVAHGTAQEPVLTFQGLESLEQVLDFYAGGVGGEGSGPGPDFGITFSDNALAIISQEAGASGNFAQNPSGDTVLFFLEGDAATMNLSDGFEAGFSFYYSACCEPGTVIVYDGIDGTGNVLAQLDLPTTPSTDDTPYAYDNWQPVGVEFGGVARSVDFGGTIDRIGFDNITPGSDVPGDAGPGPDPDPGPGPDPAIPVPAMSALGAAAMVLLFAILAIVIVPRLSGPGG